LLKGDLNSLWISGVFWCLLQKEKSQTYHYAENSIDLEIPHLAIETYSNGEVRKVLYIVNDMKKVNGDIMTLIECF
jgi:hypothetical protein